MNSKNIKLALHAKIKRWIDNVDDPAIQKLIKDNAIITGGAIVSMLTGEEVHDYDVYFRTENACQQVALYYARKFNEAHDTRKIDIINDKGRITCFIRSAGVAAEDDEKQADVFDDSGISDETEPGTEVDSPDELKPKYRPVFFSTNAITLSDKIQLVIRFYGEPQQIHENYDFVHCTCCYSFYDNTLTLPQRALEAIINKELFYVGSRYPVCSIIRTRKFLARGWTINAGQYLKMCLQVSALNLLDLEVFKDQLAGVDSAYFNKAIEYIQKSREENPDLAIDNSYLFDVINRIF